MVRGDNCRRCVCRSALVEVSAASVCWRGVAGGAVSRELGGGKRTTVRVGGGDEKIDSLRYGRLARVRAGRRRALTASPEDGQFVLSARFVMPAVVLPTHHCVAATNTTTTTTTSSPSAAAAAAVTIAATAAAGNNTTACTTTLYWLPAVDSPACCYCGGRIFVLAGAPATGSSTATNSVRNSISCFDACSSPASRDNFGPFCRCDGAVATTSAVVFFIPYMLGPQSFRPVVLPPAFITAKHLRHQRRINHHRLFNTAVTGSDMETR